MAKQIDSKVSYGVGFKVNLGNYQTVDLHFGESATFDVSDLDPDEAQSFMDGVREQIVERLDGRLKQAISEIGTTSGTTHH